MVHNELSPAVPKGFDDDDYNADAPLNLMEVKDGRITTPKGMSYRALVLPTGDWMTLPVLQKIAKLVRDGRTITQHFYGAGKVVWGEHLEKVLGVPADFIASKGDLLFTHRKDTDADIYFVSNQGAQAVPAECSFRVADKVPECWHANSCPSLGLARVQWPQYFRQRR